jgi:hypothetical protein
MRRVEETGLPPTVISGTFNKMLLGGTGGRISDYHPSEGEAEDK